MNIFKRNKYELANGTLRHTIASNRVPGSSWIKIHGEVQRLVGGEWRSSWYKMVKCEREDRTLQLRLMRESVDDAIKDLRKNDSLFYF